MTTNTKDACETCPIHDAAALKKLGVDMSDFDYVVALAGNPNTGKSTVFNALTGLRQHTGNWPGKTVSRAEGGFEYGDHKYKMVDLPGTYSIDGFSSEEKIVKDFLQNKSYDVILNVIDSTNLTRNMLLTLELLNLILLVSCIIIH